VPGQLVDPLVECGLLAREGVAAKSDRSRGFFLGRELEELAVILDRRMDAVHPLEEHATITVFACRFWGEDEDPIEATKRSQSIPLTQVVELQVVEHPHIDRVRGYRSQPLHVEVDVVGSTMISRSGTLEIPPTFERKWPGKPMP